MRPVARGERIDLGRWNHRQNILQKQTKAAKAGKHLNRRLEKGSSLDLVWPVSGCNPIRGKVFGSWPTHRREQHDAGAGGRP